MTILPMLAVSISAAENINQVPISTLFYQCNPTVYGSLLVNASHTRCWFGMERDHRGLAVTWNEAALERRIINLLVFHKMSISHEPSKGECSVSLLCE